MNCSGSYLLTQLIRSHPEAIQDDDPEYRRDGVEAHRLAAYCLDNQVDAWMAMGTGDYPNLDAEMADAVQMYLDYVRPLPGEHSWELKMHRPELHPLAFGTLDFSAIPRAMATVNPEQRRITPRVLEFVDYKHGAGVIVEPERNPQVMYYAYLKLGDDADYDDLEVVKLTIVQPRGYHTAGAIRSWLTTVGEIRRFAHDELAPAMARALASGEIYLNMGSWCHFCPAKLICPAMHLMADAARALATNKKFSATSLTAQDIGHWYERTEVLKFFIKAIEGEALRRLMEGQEIPGLKLVHAKTDRVWKPGAPIQQWMQPAKPMSPAMVEKQPGGAKVVEEWAIKPEGAPTIASASDKRIAISIKPTEQKFQKALDRLGVTT